MGGGTFVGAKRQTRAIMGIAIVVGAEKVMTKKDLRAPHVALDQRRGGEKIH
jgi:hypothetical protein